MKTCKRFHFEDVEPGDKLFLGGGRTREFNDKPDPDVEITVRSAYRTVHFGEMIDATNGETYYLDDWDVIRFIDEEPSAAARMASGVAHKLNALADWHEQAGTALRPHEMRALASEYAHWGKDGT